MRLALVIAISLALTGCARMGTRQGDKSTTTTVYGINEKGRTNSITVTEIRETTTRASGTTAGTASSTLKGFSARQDGKNQGLAIKESEQKSDIDKMVDVFGGMLRLAGAMQGVPVGQAAPPNSPAIPEGWKLVPKDDPSKPKSEVEE